MSAPDFTPREEELMKKIWLCMKTAPEIDFKLLATHMDCAPKTVSNLWGKVKNKLGLPPATPGAKAEASTKKTTADVDEGGAVAEAGDGDEAANGNGFTAINAMEPATPKKTPKRSLTKRKMKDAATTTAEGEGDGGADADATPKKRVRKTPVKKADKTQAIAKEGDVDIDFEASQTVAVDEGIAFKAVHEEEEEDIEGVPMTNEEAFSGMAAPSSDRWCEMLTTRETLDGRPSIVCIFGSDDWMVGGVSGIREVSRVWIFDVEPLAL